MLIPLLSAFIQPAVAPPGDIIPPSGLAVSRYGAKYVELTWSPAVNGAVYNVRSYKLYINGVWDGVLIPMRYMATTMSADKLTLSPNTQYQFKVSAVDNAGNESGFSNTITITTPRNQDVGQFKKRRYVF